MFKKIVAKFKVVDSSNNSAAKDYVFEVKRIESGAAKYGDRSAHTLAIVGTGFNELYDTRYDNISTKKDQWTQFWKDYIKKQWRIKVEVADYIELCSGTLE